MAKDAFKYAAKKAVVVGISFGAIMFIGIAGLGEPGTAINIGLIFAFLGFIIAMPVTFLIGLKKCHEEGHYKSNAGVYSGQQTRAYSCGSIGGDGPRGTGYNIWYFIEQDKKEKVCIAFWKDNGQ